MDIRNARLTLVKAAAIGFECPVGSSARYAQVPLAGFPLLPSEVIPSALIAFGRLTDCNPVAHGLLFRLSGARRSDAVLFSAFNFCTWNTLQSPDVYGLQFATFD